ncbi:uncharacterized protein LOC144093560 isoform X2 [Amblyomma americanum]
MAPEQMGEAEKPFACDVSGCGIKFVCEDKLTSHKRRHKMMLSLNFTNTGAGPRNCIEQTPTPTRFMDILEEAGLFQELQTEFVTPEAVHVNPFEADFRRASHGEIVSKEPSNVPSTSEPLNTPCILPVTADPIAQRGQLTPASAMVSEFGPALPSTTKAERTSRESALVFADKPAVQAGAASVNESSPLKTATVITAASEGKDSLAGALISDKASAPQGSVASTPQTTANGVVTTETILAAASPIAQVLPGVSTTNVASVLAAPVITPSTAPVVPAVGPLSGPKATTIITPSNVIQIGDSVQLLIVANSAAAVGTTAQLPPAAAATATVPLLQQSTEKLKDALTVKGLSSNGEKQASKRTVPAAQISGTVIAPSDANLSDGNRNRRADAFDDERKKKNRENNRYAAQRSRAKKKRMSEAIRKELEDYKKLCAELTARNQDLLNQRSMSREAELHYKDEIFNLKKQLALHSNCSVTLEMRKKEKDGLKNQRKPTTEIVPQVPTAIAFPSALALPAHLSLVVATKDSLPRSILK